MREVPPQRAALSTFELVAMVATLSALNALGIDIMLPALPEIGRDFAIGHENDRQLVVVIYLASFGLAQLVYGPLTDAFGRRGVLLAALGIFVAGSLLCVVAPTFEIFLAARALQGVGSAATRVIAVAVVRDLMDGRRMAQIMSMAMTIFMVVPIVAPTLGQLILLAAPWRWIFGALLLYTLAIAAWAFFRLPETLAPENRRPFALGAIISGYWSVISNRQVLGYTLASIFLTGALFGYVASSEQLFVEVYDLGPWFAAAFAAVAIAISIGTFLNARLVMRYGMRRLSYVMTIAFAGIAISHVAFIALGWTSLPVFMLMLALTFCTFGLISSNFGALAMDPVGHIAGSASALFGAATATGGALIGGIIGRAYDGTTGPFAISVVIAALVTIATLLWLERGQILPRSDTRA